MILIDVTKNDAKVTHTEKLTSGTVGLKCQFNFSEEWNELSKIAVCVCGSVVKDAIVDENNTIEIPWEVLAKHGKYLDIGVYGSDGDGVRVIPTVYATVGAVCKGADPSGDESITPTPTIWEQILAFVKNVPYTIDAMGKAIFHGHSESASADEKGNTIHTHYMSVGDANNTFCNAIKGTANGRGAVRIEGVSPVPHNLDIKLKRVNLIDESWTTGVGYYFPVEVGKTYTFSCKVKDDVEIPTDLTISIWNYSLAINHNIICDGNVESTEVSFTVADGDEWCIESTIGIKDYIENIQLEEGSTASAYVPYIKDLNDVKFKTYGKNLLDVTKAYPRNNKDTIEVIDKDTIRWNGSYWFFLPVSIPAGATFRISIKGYEVESGTCNGFKKWYMEYEDGTNSGEIVDVYTATAKKNVKCIVIYKNPAAGTASVVIKGYQIELGDTKTAYESYKEPKEPVDNITIVQPTTTIVADTPGVNIEATYNRDINEVLAKYDSLIANV